MVHGVHHLLNAPVCALQPGQRLGGGDGQQHAGGGDLGGVADVGLGRGGLQGPHIGVQLGHIGADGVFAPGLVHAVPPGQLQHGHGEGVGVHPELEFDGPRIVPGVGQVQRAAPLRVQGADFGHGDIVAAIHQPDGRPLPDARLSEILGGNHIDRRIAGQLGIDGHRGPRPGGHAQGLEGTGALPGGVLGGGAALEIIFHHAQGGSVARQQRPGQLQLVPQPGQIQIEVGLSLQPGGEGGDLLPGHTRLEGSEGAVGKQRGDIVGQAVALVEGHLGDAHPAAVALPLVKGDGQGLDALYRGEGQHQIALLGVHGGGVIKRFAEQGLPLAVLGGHGVGAQGILVVSGQVRHQDDIVHVLGLAEGIGEVAVQAPAPGNPVGGRVAVHHLSHGKAGAERPVYVAGIGHGHRLDQPIVNAVLLGQLGHGQLLPLGGARGGGGVGARAPAVARLHRYLIGHAVGQAGDKGGGAGQVAAILGEDPLARRAVEDLVVGRVLGFAPAQPQGLVGGGHGDVGGRAGDAARLRGSGHHLGGRALPIAVDGGDLELVGFQVLQPCDCGPGGIGGHLPVQTAAGAVVDDIAGDVAHSGPLQGHLSAAGGGGEVLHLVVFGVFGYDVFQELNLSHHGKVRVVLGCGDGDGDLLHGYLAAQVDGDHPLLRRGANGMYSLGEGGVEGDGKGGAIGQLRQRLPLLDGAGAVGTGDLDLAHLHRLSAKADGQGDRLRVCLLLQGDGPVLPEQVGGVPRDVGGVHLGRDDGGGGLLYQGLAGASHVMADISQVGDVHPAVPIQIERRRAAAQHGVHGGQVRSVNLSVPVHVAQGEGAVPGAHNQVLGIPVQGDGLGEGLVTRSGELHLVALGGGQAGELQRIIAHPPLAGQRRAVHVFHLDRDGLGAARQGDGDILSTAGHTEPDAPPSGAVRRLGQVEPEGEPDRAGGGRGVRRACGGYARQAEGAHHNQAEYPGDQSSSCFHVCHSLLIAPTLC